MKHTIRMATAGLALAAALTLAGCGAIEDAVSDKVDDAVADATDEAKDAIEDAVVTGDAEVDLGIDGTVDLPDDFPSSLPLPDGNLTASYSDASGWALTYTLDGGDKVDAFVEALKGDGALTVVEEAESAEITILNLESDAHTIEIIAENVADGSATIFYGVYVKNQ